MNAPTPDIAEIFAQAEAYAEKADVYNAVKLYKKVIKHAPEWALPWARLASIYKGRSEWKPCMHYAKNAVSLDPSQPEWWWDLSIAAAALGKGRLARSIWSKFAPAADTKTKLISLQLQHNGIFEMIWAKPIDPVRAQITSIPHPGSGRRFMDIVFHDQQKIGYNVARKKRFPVYAALGVDKHSLFQTWTCWLEMPDKKDLQTLETLCRDNALGFEVWSSAQRSTLHQFRDDLREFYSEDLAPVSEPEDLQVALAARRPEHVEQVLQAWTIISLKQYADLQRLG
jgi:hypothetical protein